MTAEPQEARPPREVFARVETWLSQRGSQPTAPARPAVARHAAMDLVVDGCAVRETPMLVRHAGVTLFGILTEPVGNPPSPPAELCAVFLDSGAIRRVGQGRMWVDTARRWATRGVPSLRLDVEGIGDSDGDATRYSDVAELYVPELVDQVCAALDALERRGVGRRFILTGLCSGAYWSFHAALRDVRVRSAVLVNPRVLVWDEGIEDARSARRVLKLLQPSSWRRILRGYLPREQLLGFARGFARSALRAPGRLARRALRRGAAGGASHDDELDRALETLRVSGRQLVLAFSGNEPLCTELERDGRLERLRHTPGVRVASLPGIDHTLRPLWVHDAVHALLDEALAATSEPGAVARSA